MHYTSETLAEIEQDPSKIHLKDDPKEIMYDGFLKLRKETSKKGTLGSVTALLALLCVTSLTLLSFDKRELSHEIGQLLKNCESG